MRYFKTPDGDIRAIEDCGSQDCLISEGWVEYTEEEALQHANDISFSDWISDIVKSTRDKILLNWDKVEFQVAREINLGITPKFTLEQVWNYKHAVHMFPDSLTEIEEELVWPPEPTPS